MAGTVRWLISFKSIQVRRIRKDMYKECIRFTSSVSPLGMQRQINSDDNNYVKKKIGDLMQWYEEVTGMDEVRLAQNRVLDAEQNFISAQERRREASKEVAAVQEKLKELYAELDSTSRGEERYVQIITQEHRVLKEERRLVNDFQRYEREERDYFSSLSTAVKDSHEKERAQAEKTKYWSIIGSIIGTALGIAGSSINNEIKMKQLRKLVQDSIVNKAESGVSSNVPDALTKHERELSLLVNQLKTVASQPNDHILGRLNELIHNIEHKPQESETSIDNIISALRSNDENNNRNFNELKSMLKSDYSITRLDGETIVLLPYGLEDRVNEVKNLQLVMLATTALLGVFTVIKYMGFG